MGRGTIWRSEIKDCIHQNHIFRIRFDPELFSEEFLAYQIGSKYGKGYFFAHARQTTGIATINQTILKGFPFHVPHLLEQTRIVNELNSIQSMADSIQQQIETIAALQVSLLRKSFSGAL